MIKQINNRIGTWNSERKDLDLRGVGGNMTNKNWNKKNNNYNTKSNYYLIYDKSIIDKYLDNIQI